MAIEMLGPVFSSGCVSWLVVTVVLIAFWAIPVAVMLALFRARPAAHRKGAQCR